MYTYVFFINIIAVEGDNMWSQKYGTHSTFTLRISIKQTEMLSSTFSKWGLIEICISKFHKTRYLCQQFTYYIKHYYFILNPTIHYLQNFDKK